MGGDAKDYYSALPATFINHDLQQQHGDEWYLLQTDKGVINVHPVGIALLQLPFFLFSLLLAKVSGSVVDGYSLPFQMGIAIAGISYALLGLYFLVRVLRQLQFTEKIIAVTIIALYFGTNLMHYTLAEPGMSHVYSFALLSAYLFYTQKCNQHLTTSNVISLGLLIGLILLVRPNNLLFLPLGLIWFKSVKEVLNFFGSALKNKITYFAITSAALMLSIQPIVWWIQSGSLFQNTYKRDGFYWLHPQLKEMLFGFDGGFFIYVPLCLLLLAGLLPLLKQNRFAAVLISVSVLLWFYFFSCYWAYTYFDGFGIRVLVDYYSVFGVLAAYLFTAVKGKLVLQGSLYSVAAALLLLNFIYTYQANRGILLRAGMNFNMWRYVFLKTDKVYQNSLGGAHEMKPFASAAPELMLADSIRENLPFDFSENEFGPALDHLQLRRNTNRFRVELVLARKEITQGASDAAMLVVSVDNPETRSNKAYQTFKLNETPATGCCSSVRYHYTTNVVGNFTSGDRVTVYVWNQLKGKFYLEHLAARLYDYNYNLN